jgi:hypothetical protein
VEQREQERDGIEGTTKGSTTLCSILADETYKRTQETPNLSNNLLVDSTLFVISL